jgi:hypothetical protein
MLILYELIHSLAKEEKRLYQLHKRDVRYQRIYEGYVRALQFSKELDQQLYQDHFSDVSRAFFSMQKRSLLDDILLVLQEYSNSQNPGYQFIRLYGRARVMLERGLGEAAISFGSEAYASAAAAGNSEQMALALRTQQDALLITAQPSLQRYQDLLKQEQELSRSLGPRERLLKLQHTFRLLKLNSDQLDAGALREQAKHYYERLNALSGLEDMQDLEVQLGRLACEDLYHQVMEQPDAFHRMIVQFHKRVAPTVATQHAVAYYKLTNHVLRSGLRAGDFLLLTGMIYKLSKEIPALNADLTRSFLPEYYETCALFSFYEADLPQALKYIDQAIRHDATSPDALVRCVFYRLAMLVAAHLPKQARDEIVSYSSSIPELKDEPLLWLIEVLIAIEAKEPTDDVLFLIERHRNALKKRKDGKLMLEAMGVLITFLERKKGKDREVRAMPAEWENLLRVDLYVRAKLDTSFYYNLLLDDWKRRRKVF